MMKIFYLQAVLTLAVVSAYPQLTNSPAWNKFERCIQKNSQAIEYATSNFTQCMHETYKDFPQLNLKSAKEFKQILKYICRKVDVTKCFRNLESEVQICFPDDLKQTNQDVFAAFQAGLNYICREDGAKLIDLLSVPENQQCVERIIDGGFDRANDCSYFISSKVFRLEYHLNEKNCQALRSARSCYVQQLKTLCPGEKGLIDYGSKLHTEFLRATPCKKFLKLKDDVSQHGKKGKGSFYNTF